MDPVAIIIMLLVGAVAGWLAGQIMKGAGYGLIGNIIVGILGAIVAGFLLPGFFTDRRPCRINHQRNHWRFDPTLYRWSAETRLTIDGAQYRLRVWPAQSRPFFMTPAAGSKAT